jgi:hypothetical protein
MKTCIIMGNGKSLNDMPLDLLLKYDSFGVNYAKHQPTYYVSVDTDILLYNWQKVYDLAAGAKTAYLSLKHDGSSPLYKLPHVQMVTHDKGAFIGEKYFSGLTVSYVCLKIAYYMDFDIVHLWGIDHDKNWSHFRPDYPPGAVDRRQWRMDNMIWHYQHAMNVYAKAGKRIVNFSHPSELDSIFERGTLPKPPCPHRAPRVAGVGKMICDDCGKVIKL